MATTQLRALSERPVKRCDVDGYLNAGVAVVTVSGVLDAQSAATAQAAVDKILRHRPAWVVLDVSGVRTTESAVAVLAVLRDRAARHGTHLVLAGPAPTLFATLHALDVADQYDIRHSVNEAVDAATTAGRRSPAHSQHRG